jgi:hypothetical protein
MAKQGEATLLLRIKQVGADVLDRMVITFGDLINAAKWLANALQEPLRAWREQELATNQLNTAMVNQGVYTRELAASYASMAEELAKVTLYEDNAIIKAQAILQAYLGQTKITKELVQATLDLASAKGMDLASAAELVGKSIGTSTNALGRHGVAIDTTASKQERLSQVLTAIEKKWHGQAEAAASGTGVFLQVQKSVGELAENLGQRLSPVLELAAKQVLKFTTNTQNSGPVIEGIANVMLVLIKAGDIVVTTFQTLGNSIGAIFAALSVPVSLNVKKMWEQVKAISDAANADNEAAEKAHQDRMLSYDNAFHAKKVEEVQKTNELIRQSNENKRAVAADQSAVDAANEALRMEQERLGLETHLQSLSDAELAGRLRKVNDALAIEQDATTRFKLEQQKQLLNQNLNNEEIKRSEEALYKFKEERRRLDIENQKSTFATIATLQSANNGVLAAIGKAAAITQIAIDTPVAIGRALAAFPPPFNFAAAGLVGAAMAAQAARVAGIPLAEGGIVRATPGGIQATIGEGGRDEAVIPLDSPEAQGRLGGGGVTVHFNGPVMGDPSQAREFAIALDRELVKLRRDGESLAFDSRIT